MTLSTEEMAKIGELTESFKTWFTPRFSEVLAKRLVKYDTDVQKVTGYEFLPGSTYGTVEYTDSDGDIHHWRIDPNPIQ